MEPSTQPFFSIIIPTFNRAKYLQRTLDAIFAQDYTSYEVIIVDDGSTDDTQKLITDIARDHGVLKYFYKENEERSIARNYGIKKAQGRYIGFLDSDDTVYTNHLRVAYELLKRNDFPEVGHLGFKAVDAEGNIVSQNTFDDSFKEKLIHNNILHGNAIFIRKDVASEVNFIPSRFAVLSEDWYVWLRLAARYRFHFDNTVTSAVHHHSGRSLMNIDPDKLIANTNVLVDHLKKDEVFMKAFRGKTSYHFANHYTFLALILALTKKRRRDSVRYLAKAVAYDPTLIARRTFLGVVKHLL